MDRIRFTGFSQAAWRSEIELKLTNSETGTVVRRSVSKVAKIIDVLATHQALCVRRSAFVLKIRPRGVMWLRKCGQRICCPEGSNDGSQPRKTFGAGTRPIENPSRRARSDPYPRLINRPNGGTPIGPNYTVPSGTVSVFAPIPGNKLPGYFHNVPTGQRLLTPAHEFEATSERRSIGVLEYCANLEVNPASAGLGMFFWFNSRNNSSARDQQSFRGQLGASPVASGFARLRPEHPDPQTVRAIRSGQPLPPETSRRPGFSSPCQ